MDVNEILGTEPAPWWAKAAIAGLVALMALRGLLNGNKPR